MYSLLFKPAELGIYLSAAKSILTDIIWKLECSLKLEYFYVSFMSISIKSERLDLPKQKNLRLYIFYKRFKSQFYSLHITKEKIKPSNFLSSNYNFNGQNILVYSMTLTISAYIIYDLPKELSHLYTSANLLKKR